VVVGAEQQNNQPSGQFEMELNEFVLWSREEKAANAQQSA
jgi:hypothetical protein